MRTHLRGKLRIRKIHIRLLLILILLSLTTIYTTLYDQQPPTSQPHQLQNPQPQQQPQQQYQLSCQIQNKQQHQTTKIQYTNEQISMQISEKNGYYIYYSATIRQQLESAGLIGGSSMVDMYGRLCSSRVSIRQQVFVCEDDNVYNRCRSKVITVPVSDNTQYTLYLNSTTMHIPNNPSKQPNTIQPINNTDNQYNPHQIPNILNNLQHQQLTQQQQIQHTQHKQQYQIQSWVIIIYILTIISGTIVSLYGLYSIIYWYQHNGLHTTAYSNDTNTSNQNITRCIKHLFDNTDINSLEQFVFVNQRIRKYMVGDWSSLYLLKPAIQQPIYIKINKLTTWPINIGIIYTTTNNRTHTITKLTHRSMIYGSGGTYFNGCQYTLANGSGFGVGETVMVGLDVENRVAKWVVGGQVRYQVPVQYDREESGQWRFVVQMRGKGDQIELVL